MNRIWLIIVLMSGFVNWAISQNVSSGNELEEEKSKPFFISVKNAVYGLGDINGWYKNTPTGDTIFHLTNDYFAVRNSSRYSIIDEDFKILFKGIISAKPIGNYFVLQDSSGYRLFGLSEQQITNRYDSIKITEPYLFLYKHNKQGVVHVNWKFKSIIDTQYDKVGPYLDGFLLINKGKLGWLGDSLSIPLEFDHIYKERPDIIAAKNAKGTIYFDLTSRKQLLIEPKDSVVFYNNYYKRVRGKEQSIFYRFNNQLMGSSTKYQLHPYSFDLSRNLNGYYVGVKDSLCALFKNNVQLTDFSYDNILFESVLHPPYFKIVKNNQVGVILENGNVQLKPQYTEIFDVKGDYYIVRVGNKSALVTKNDSVIIPPTYKTIKFNDNKYLWLSTNGRDYALYDYQLRKMLTAEKYHEFSVFENFIVARCENKYDVYFQGTNRLSGLFDLQVNKNTVKGYRDGKVFIGYARNNKWDEYNYEIPIYNVVNDSSAYQNIKPYFYPNENYIYDYVTGKWGNYSYSNQSWLGLPIAHGGFDEEGIWLLDFNTDTTLKWNGLNFHLRKKIAPIDWAWQNRSKFDWIDVRHFGYYTRQNTRYDFNSISPIFYSVPGNGKCFDNYSKAVNYVFNAGSDKSILAENGRLEISDKGDLFLSDYLTHINSSGTLYPQTLQDYEQIINPSLKVSFVGATEHVLQQVIRNSSIIPYTYSFDWIDKRFSNPLVVKMGNKFGLFSDSTYYILKPEYESINLISAWGNSYFKLGKASSNCKLYYPSTNSFSRIICDLLEAKDCLLLVSLGNEEKAVLNLSLDTLYKTLGRVTLLGANDYCIEENGESLVKRDKAVLFKHLGNFTEKINETHFVIHTPKTNYIANQSGDTLFKSTKAIKFVTLDKHYLLEDGTSHILYDDANKAMFSFSNSRYIINSNNDLIVIGDNNQITVFEHNSKNKVVIKGKLLKLTNNYVITDLGKVKELHTLKGNSLISKALKIMAINDNYASYKKKNKFYLLNVRTKEELTVKSLNVNLLKTGIVEEEDEETEDEEGNGMVLNNRVETDSISISEHKGYFGLKKGEAVVLKNKYFDIKQLSGAFLIRDQLEYRLFNSYSRQFISPDSYDDVQAYKNYLVVKKNGVISYLTFSGKMISITGG